MADRALILIGNGRHVRIALSGPMISVISSEGWDGGYVLKRSSACRKRWVRESGGDLLLDFPKCDVHPFIMTGGFVEGVGSREEERVCDAWPKADGERPCASRGNGIVECTEEEVSNGGVGETGRDSGNGIEQASSRIEVCESSAVLWIVAPGKETGCVLESSAGGGLPPGMTSDGTVLWPCLPCSSSFLTVPSCRTRVPFMLGGTNVASITSERGRWCEFAPPKSEHPEAASLSAARSVSVTPP